jgi:hypothetical protein
MPRLPANTASSSRPESSGLSPNASWNINGKRNGTALMAVRNSTPPLTVTAKLGTLNAVKSSSGWTARNAWRTA